MPRAKRVSRAAYESAAEVVERLRRLDAASAKPIRIGHQPTTLQRGVRRHFGSAAGGRRAAGIRVVDLTRKWTRQAIIDRLRELHRQGVRLTYRSLYKAGETGMVSASHRVMRGLRAARRIARVPEPPRLRPTPGEPWSAELVVAEIIDRHRAGESVAATRVPPPLYAAGAHYLGSWRAAIEAAGLDYATVRLLPEYSDEELLSRLRKVAGAHPGKTQTDLDRLGHGRLIQALRYHFGSLEEAGRRAGLRGWPPMAVRRAMTRAEVLRTLRQRHRAGLGLRVREVAEADHGLLTSALIYFPVWGDAIEAAGLRRWQLSWTRDHVERELRARHQRGSSLQPMNIQAEDARLFSAIVRYFGSVSVALREIGVGHAAQRGRSASQAPFSWTPAAEALLGTMSDRRLAGRLGTVAHVVTLRRSSLGIPPATRRRWRRKEWTAAMVSRLGTASDARVAKALGLGMTTVERKRKALGIPPSGGNSRRPIQWTAAMLADIWRLSLAAVAAKYGISTKAVAARRAIQPRPSVSPTERAAALEAKFLAQVKKTPTCWLWQGLKFVSGAGGFFVGGKHVQAHRFAYDLAHPKRPVRRGVLVHQTCGDRLCVNPAHLVLETYKDKIHRTIAAGRMGGGEKSASARFSNEQVRSFRELVWSGVPTRVAAERTGIDSKSAAYSIAQGRSWRLPAAMPDPFSIKPVAPPSPAELAAARAARFWNKVKKTPSCWLWQGHEHRSGCGMFYLGPGKGVVAHRFAYQTAHHDEPLRQGAIVHQTCGKPLCVNPAHLTIETHREKFRRINAARIAAGKPHTAARFTVAQVRAFRELVAAGTSIPTAARRFGMSRNTAHRIARGEGWRIPAAMPGGGAPKAEDGRSTRRTTGAAST